MILSSTRPPGSTFTISGSASVGSLARKASYFTSFRSGAAPPPMVDDAPMLEAPPVVDPEAMVAEDPLVEDELIPAMPVMELEELDEPAAAAAAMEAMLPPFFSVSKICSGGVKLKS